MRRCWIAGLWVGLLAVPACSTQPATPDTAFRDEADGATASGGAEPNSSSGRVPPNDGASYDAASDGKPSYGASSSGTPVSAVSAPVRHNGRISDRFPNIVLRAHDGRELRFYDDLVRDRTVFINFMYTRCDGI